MNGKKVIISMFITVLLGTGSISNVCAKENYIINRLGGQDRIETSVKIANDFNSGQLSAVLVANANDFKEALVGSTLAAKYKAPILLVNQTAQDSQSTLEYIKGHLTSDGTVYILGQTSSVSLDVEKAIKNMGYSNIKRIAGTNEDETLKAINSELNVAKGTPVFIASKRDFPDTISASAVAAIKGYPIILCDPDIVIEWMRDYSIESYKLSQAVIDQLENIKPSKVYILGGYPTLKSLIVGGIKKNTGLTSENVIRIYGWDRYGTSIALARYFNLNTSNAVLASGESFADALAGSSLAVKNNAPLILVSSDTVEQKRYLDINSINNLTILGGEGVISNNIISDLIANKEVSGADTYSNPFKKLRYSLRSVNNCLDNRIGESTLWQTREDMDFVRESSTKAGFLTEAEIQELIEEICKKRGTSYDEIKRLPPGIAEYQ